LHCTDSVPRPSKCTEIVGGWGFVAPDPTGGAYSAPPDPLAGLRGPTSKERGGRGFYCVIVLEGYSYATGAYYAGDGPP